MDECRDTVERLLLTRFIVASIQLLNPPNEVFKGFYSTKVLANGVYH